MHTEEKKLSDLLKDILARHNGERVSVKALAHDLHQQGLPLLMAVFAIPACIPIPYPPGVATFIAICISVFAIQLLWLREELWLPRWVAARTISRALADKIIAKTLPKIERFEHLFKARWEHLVTPRWEKITACVTLLMNFLISIPLPGIHFFPGWAILLMCLGLLNRDGKVVAIGLGMAIFGCIVALAEIRLGETAIHALMS